MWVSGLRVGVVAQAGHFGARALYALMQNLSELRITTYTPRHFLRAIRAYCRSSRRSFYSNQAVSREADEHCHNRRYSPIRLKIIQF